jgi:CP family cyanate transporter-like MFS transporter
MVLEIIGLVVRPWSGGPWPFVVFSVVALLGMGIGNVVLPVLVKAWFPHRIAAVTSVYVMGLTAGTSFPALLAVPVADAAAHTTGSSRLGWQIGLAWWAVVCVIVAVAWAGPAAHPCAVPASTGGDERHDGGSGQAGLPLWRSSTALGLMMIFAANSLSSYALFAWLPTRLTDAGVSEATAGALLAVFGGMGVPAALTVPHLAARGHHTFLLVAQFVAAFVVGELGLLLAPQYLTLLWVVLAGWGSGGFSLALALIGLRSRTPAGAGALSGFTQCLGYLFAGFGPITVGILRQTTGGWTAPFAVLRRSSRHHARRWSARLAHDDRRGGTRGKESDRRPIALTRDPRRARCRRSGVPAGRRRRRRPRGRRAGGGPRGAPTAAGARRLVDERRAAARQAGRHVAA